MRESKIFVLELKRYRDACLRELRQQYSIIGQEEGFIFLHKSSEFFKAGKTPEELCRELVKELRK